MLLSANGTTSRAHASMVVFVLFMISMATSFQLMAHKRAIRTVMKSKLNSEVILSNCPFSRTYPRFRIDLTRSTKSSSVNKGLNFFGGLQSAWFRNKVSKQFGSSVLFMVEQSGIRAVTNLWQASARLAAGESDQVVLAFLDCDSRILVNWKELLDWMHDNMSDELQVKTTLHESNQVVQMERVGGTSRQEFCGDRPVTNPEAITRTKAWVKRILVELGICPFTKSVSKSGQGLGDVGVPVANIDYQASNATCVYQLMADTWQAITNMIAAGPSGKDGTSSILLAAPSFDHDFDFWSGPVFTLLESCVVAAQAESQIGVVCFHPQYATPDGTSWPGFGHMHSVPRLERWLQEVNGVCTLSQEDVAAGGAWQRRTPHATINVLRADQLEKAESKRKTPQLYARNIEVLVGIGNDKLREDLERERRL